MNITIAGASGFIGTNLIPIIGGSHNVKALSRFDRARNDQNVIGVKADLFSYQSACQALQNTDVAIYLVHSMLPSSKYFQGNFQDTDLLIADNFSRACEENKVKQIIFLGGLVPEGVISKHLASRKEVEEIFEATGIPLTVFRTGMVVGDGGSSFEILKNLVFNLPIMILPAWTKSNTQVIFVDDLVRIINQSIGNKLFFNKTVNVVTGETLNYKELIEQASKYFEKRKILIPVPVNYTGFSKLWVSLFGNSTYSLVSPLIDGLLCDLSGFKSDPMIKDFVKYQKYQDMLHHVSRYKIKRKKKGVPSNGNTVASIQRLRNPKKLSNMAVCKKYFYWLSRKLFFLNDIEIKQDLIEIKTKFFSRPLLKLSFSREKDNVDRVKLIIDGGILSKERNNGWLEFRQVADRKFTLVSIHHYIPSLPWSIYKITQAPIHRYLMESFEKYLCKLPGNDSNRDQK